MILNLLVATEQAAAQDSQDLVKKLANPIASLIHIPFDLDYDPNIGPVNDGERVTVIAKPVVPITLNPESRLQRETLSRST